MQHISVVIIAKNEAENIVDCIKSARQISKDIIVADSGSEDGTAALVIDAGAKLLSVEWKGYGQTRNEAATIATNDWVLALDADERITPALSTAINNLSFINTRLLFGFKRVNFLGSKKIRFGEWGRDKVYRLYNKQQAAWNTLLVHENIIGNGISKKLMEGEVLHYTMKDISEYYSKTILYAQLSAQKYADQGKNASFTKRFISPIFSFVQNYIFRLGFLDGREGLIIAYTTSRYIFLKYQFLKQLIRQKSQIINE
jgi:glycosyltransferase involved in cell wall biosynthesis